MSRTIIYILTMILSVLLALPYAVIGPTILFVIPIVFMQGVGAFHIANDLADFVEGRKMEHAVKPQASPAPQSALTSA